MQKSITIFCFVLILFFSCGLKKKSLTCSEILNSYDQLQLKIKDVSFSDSIYDVLQKIKQKDSGCIYVNLLLAEIFKEKQKYFDAIKEYRLAIRKENLNIYAIYNLGRIYYLINNYDSAISCFRFSLKLKGGNGFIFEKNKDYNKVLGISSIDVSYGDIIFSNAKASYFGKYYIDANNEFKYCIANNINLSESYYFLGLIYLKIDEFKDACRYFKMAKENGNSDVDSLLDKYCKALL